MIGFMHISALQCKKPPQWAAMEVMMEVSYAKAIARLEESTRLLKEKILSNKSMLRPALTPDEAERVRRIFRPESAHPGDTSSQPQT